MSFETLPCEPDQPFPPKLIQRSKTNLNLRWNSPFDNGRHITHFAMESDQGKGGEFVEVFNGRNKTFNYNKLTSATTYRFRLQAVSSIK